MPGRRVMVVGGGGREHALAVSLARSPNVDRVMVAPGNGGTFGGKLRSIDLDPGDFDSLIAVATMEGIGLVVVGPEAPLAAGIIDKMTAAGLRCFGPTAAAARLEASKAHCKRFMVEHDIPCAESRSFTDAQKAREFAAQAPWPMVVKASGLAGGKGVIMCDTVAQAHAAIDVLMVDKVFGDAGDELLIEQRLVGQEASVLAFCDGETAVAMPAAQDHKRAFDDDRGANTGGMGAYAPAPLIDDAALAVITDTVLQPVVDGMRASGTPFVGILFAGIMVTEDGPKVLEFNCRFGDPETQVLLPLLRSDLLTVLNACVDGTLTPELVRFRDSVAATVVAAAEGYPQRYTTGHEIVGVDAANELPGVTVYHAGTMLDGDTLVTSGGRVLAVTGVGDTIEIAVKRAYAGMDLVAFEGMHYRTDIGWRALANGDDS